MKPLLKIFYLLLMLYFSGLAVAIFFNWYTPPDHAFRGLLLLMVSSLFIDSRWNELK